MPLRLVDKNGVRIRVGQRIRTGKKQDIEIVAALIPKEPDDHGVVYCRDPHGKLHRWRPSVIGAKFEEVGE